MTTRDAIKQLRELADKLEKADPTFGHADIATRVPEEITQTYFSAPVPPGLIKNLREEHQRNLNFGGRWKLNDGRIVDVIDSPAIGILRAHDPLKSTDNSINYLLLKTSDLAEKVPEPNIY